MNIKYLINDTYSDYTLKSFLRKHFQMSNGLIKRLKFAGNFRINNKVSIVTQTLKKNDLVSIDLLIEDILPKVIPTYFPIDVLYEDAHMICLNKPAGVCTHPSRNYLDNTLANYLKYYFDKNGENIKIRPVSRLDKDTSGAIIFAKNEYIHERLTFSKPYKEYIAIIKGTILGKSGMIYAPISRKTLIEREIGTTGKDAITEYRVISETKEYSLVKIRLLTGRTHQIRVHFAHIGNPLVGETLYSENNDKNIIQRQSLHSHKIMFEHPLYHCMISIIAPIPSDLRSAVKLCRLDLY